MHWCIRCIPLEKAVWVGEDTFIILVLLVRGVRVGLLGGRRPPPSVGCDPVDSQ